MTIDGQLAEAGWLVQSREQMNLGAGLGVAVREFATASGPVDYALFVGGTLCGVVEAKPEGTTLSGFSDQAARYMGERARASGPARGAGPLRIRRLRHRDPVSRPRRPGAAVAPRVLLSPPRDVAALARRADDDPQAAASDAAAADRAPARMPDRGHHEPRSFARRRPAARADPDGDRRRQDLHRCVVQLSPPQAREVPARPVPRRPHQSGAPDAGTSSRTIARPAPAGRSPSSTTSSGSGPPVSTRTPRSSSPPSSASIRMLTGRELSDEDEERSGFETGASEPQRIGRLQPGDPDRDASTSIVTDECHRSIYGTWRQVLEYFDAFIVGLTATPSKQTIGFFKQQPRRGVPLRALGRRRRQRRLRGLPHPHRDRRAGGAIPKGYQVPVRDRRTRAERYEELDEDLAYTAQELDRSVVVPNQIRTVLEAFRDSAVHRAVSRPQRGAQDPDLRQGRPPRRGDRRHRPRGVRQRQRLREEDHLSAPTATIPSS